MKDLIYVDFNDVYRLVNPKELIDVIAQCFKMYSLGMTVTPERTVMYVKGNWWGIMPSYIEGMGVSVKIVSVIPNNAVRGLRTTQGLVVLFNDETGLPVALIDGTSLTAHRTAATTAASIKYMWKYRGGTLGLIGAGFQGYHQVLYAHNVMNPDKILIYDIRMDSSKRLAQRLKSEVNVKIEVANNLKELLTDSDVIIEATTTTKPVIIGKYLKKPSHIISIGAHKPNERAIDDDAVRMSEVIAVDSRKAVLKETGDIIEPINKGIIHENDIVELGEIIAGMKPGRIGNGVTIFKTVGIAVEDTCAAHYIIKKINK